MNPLRPAGMILAACLIFLVAIIGVGIYATQADADPDDPEPTPTPQSSESDDVTETNPASDDATATSPESDDVPGDTADVSPTETEVLEAETPVIETTPKPDEVPDNVPDDVEPLSTEELAEYQPNELGRVMVLMYHRLEPEANPEDVYTRTPEQFRQDLQWLYDNDFYVIPIRDYIRNEIQAPAGKRPVVLTFDDGVASQFRLIEGDDGSLQADPNTAVGILEEFFNRYDDFGRGGLFSILPNAPFAWPDEQDQMQYAEQKLQWLVDNGYELGNHTVGHVNLREVPEEEMKAELAGAIEMIRGYVPEAEISVLAVPFGVYPPGGDTSVFKGWSYEGKQYSLEAALMVGAEPAPSPMHVEFDPMWIPRINADDSELGKWFQFVEDNPGIIYVSDGNSDTVTIPEDPHPWLVDTFDEAKAEGKMIVRY